MTKGRASVEKWWEEFAENPLNALNHLLCGQVFMGVMNRNETDEILFRLFHNKSNKKIRQLDGLMKQWFAENWGKTPGSMSPSQWADILQNAFIAVSRLNLEETSLFLRDTYTVDKSWIRSLYLGPARDPEGDLLRTLALCQKDHALLPLWMRMCRMEEDLPIDYTSIGLMGLRKLPEKDGSPQGDLPEAFFKGVVCLAEALDKRKGQQGMEHWLREVRAIIELYPRSKQYWGSHFFPFLYQQPDNLPVQWLNKAIPKLSDYFKRKSAAFIQPPPYEKVKHFMNLIKNQPLEKCRADLESFLGAERRYAYQTGDAYFLVRTFSNIGYKLFRQDVTFALELVEEAFAWEPYDPFLWSHRAIIEAFQGNVSKAAALLWEARRRFPEDPQIRSKLAHLMEKQRKYKTAETLYRQAMEDFPQDAVCRNGLADALKAQDRLDEAEAVYRQAMEDFPKDVVCRNGLAEVLKAQDRLDEAETVYRETMKRFPQNVVCRTGLVTVLLKQGERGEAISLLEKIVKAFPGNKVAKGFLGKVTQGQEITEEDEKSVQFETVKPDDTEIDFDLLLPAQSAETKKVPDEKSEKIMEKALEKSGASLIREKKPEEYGTAPFSGYIVPAINEIEAEIGEISLEHWQSRRAEIEEKEQYKQRISESVEKALKKSPRNIPALLLKGLLLAEFAANETGDFFSQQAQSHPNTIGFHLLKLRAKSLKNEPVDNSQWNDLISGFPCRSTIIKLEHVLDEFNGIDNHDKKNLEKLEKLRKQLFRKPGRLPSVLQKNEEWVKEAIQHGLFKDIDTKEPLSTQSLDTLKENFREYETVLRDTVDQCLSAAIT